jgi:hypothetical protein
MGAESAAAGGLGGAMPFIGAGIQVLGAGMNIIQGINARKDQKDAERAAGEYLAQAKQKMSVNRMQEVQVPLDAYGLQTQAILAGQQQNIDALRESGQRGLQSGLTKTQLATQEGFETQRQKMGEDIYKRDLLIAQEQSRIDQSLAQLDLQGAQGAQIAAAQNEQMAAQSFGGAIQGLGSAAQTLYEGSSLYGSGRQGELDAAKALQSQGMYQGMNTRQARRQMLDTYSTGQIQNLSTYGTTYGNKPNPFAGVSSFQAPGITVPTIGG